jgi:2-methylisocitrate lyase-like PEP mutase family enzyme
LSHPAQEGLASVSLPWPDGHGVPIDFALANAKRIADSTELSLTVDFRSRRRESAPAYVASEAHPGDPPRSRRPDLYLKTQTHDSLVDETIERGKAFADAGASGFFVPRLADPQQAERIVKEVPLPLNLIVFPGALPKADCANADVARISHGPHPHRALMAKLEEMARAAIA